MPSPQIRISGAREIARAFKNLDPAIKKTLPKELKAVAEMVAVDARQRVPSKSGKAASSIKSRSTASTAYVIGGKSSVKYYGWLDFGSRTPRRGNTRAEGPWRGSGTGPKGGRFIYPALAENRDKIVEAAADTLKRALRLAGFNQ